MNTILNLIEDYMSGDKWEELCIECYRSRYQAENYQHIPANSGGDAGIEGFTKSGVVHQCYCPERHYSDNELYDHQKNKLTTDINKLKKNSKRLKELGVPIIHEWHFNIPEYRDSRILKHAQKKQEEILAAKHNDSKTYEHIADDFTIVIKTPNDFKTEISRIIRNPITDYRLNLAFEHTRNFDWSKCDSEKVENITRKIRAIMNAPNCDKQINEIIGVYIDYYNSGLVNMHKLQTEFPLIYRDLYRLKETYENEVKIKTLMNIDHSMNRSIFESILDEFENKLEKEFSTIFNTASISELKQDMIAGWLADCSMEFRRSNE